VRIAYEWMCYAVIHYILQYYAQKGNSKEKINVCNVLHFLLPSFYIHKGGVAVARMVDAEFEYTYEYQGNAPKLVRTPLTDKCYLTLTQVSNFVI
jgi:hypothetical protein